MEPFLRLKGAVGAHTMHGQDVTVGCGHPVSVAVIAGFVDEFSLEIRTTIKRISKRHTIYSTGVKRFFGQISLVENSNENCRIFTLTGFSSYLMHGYLYA